jgi:hypothetical protein
VKSDVAPEFLSWNVSSGAENAAFAREAIPDSLCTAYTKVMLST